VKKKYIFGAVLCLVFVAIGVAACLHMIYAANSKLLDGESKVVVIEKGMNVHNIANLLQAENVIQNSQYFVYAAKLLRLSKHLKAGRYEIKNEKNSYEILQKFRDGKMSSIKVTIPEGLQTKQIFSILSNKLNVDSLKLSNLINDSSFVKKLNIPAQTLEGFIFPETYFFFWKQDEKSILKRFVEHFNGIFNDSLKIKMEQKNLTLLETITLASLIQGEAMVVGEMPTISGVYHNRLQTNMLLQADPTLQFIISDGPRRLLNADKKVDSPYNTYLYSGLPPGPVNNPGKDAILAALNPENVPYLYFVANGDGTHTFSKTLEEHLKAKRHFDKVRRDFYRKRKAGKGSQK
jgi:UPF0755 protein